MVKVRLGDVVSYFPDIATLGKFIFTGTAILLTITQMNTIDCGSSHQLYRGMGHEHISTLIYIMPNNISEILHNSDSILPYDCLV